MPESAIDPARAIRRRYLTGAGLLAVGLGGFLASAHTMGNYASMYREHVLDFVVLTVLLALIIAAIGHRFWRGRHEVTVLVLGAVQALLGVLIYVLTAAHLIS